MLESARRRTKPRTVDLYDVFCGVLYLLKMSGGCSQRTSPTGARSGSGPEEESILERVLKRIGWRGPAEQWADRADQLLVD